ncbi:MAG: ribosomal L7Ae/L30e/S12e/Gadd45 family protein [Christensenellaceae bacterium]|nr:ribosomal L7Ae/L30e/S12e/Gadd45 family protein [Christensenellaceae bacterium]
MDESIIKLLATSKVSGLRQVMRYIADDKIKCVVLAKNAELHIKNRVKVACTASNIEVMNCDSREELGTAAGLSVPCSVVGFLK